MGTEWRECCDLQPLSVWMLLLIQREEKAQQQAGRIWCGEKQKGSRRKKMPPVEWDDVESGREGKGLRMTGVKF